MRLKRLALRDFKNLKSLEIRFSAVFEGDKDRVATMPQPVRSHAIIGQNGTGKSNLIEAIVTIFRDVDLNYDVSFDYELEYDIRGHEVQLKGDLATSRRSTVKVDGEPSSQTFLSEHAREYLPSHIFTYYSGRNERIERLFQAHQRRFARIVRGQNRERSDDLVRRLFYCRGGHSQLVLLACLLADDPVFARLLGNLHIEALDSALFVLKQPHALRTLEDADILEGDPRFWYARGTVVSEFLDKLWQVSWAPIEDTKDKLIDFRGRTERQKLLYLFVPDKKKLEKLGTLVGTADRFFRYAEGAYVGDLIEEVRITVRKRDECGCKISFTQLSEGELQMLTVLGLMRITSDDQCLFLLDEPDTHLNPIWKLRYFNDIESVLQPQENATVTGESQIIVTTHDPMMIGSLRREQVRILRQEGSKTIVETPSEHPQGMGIAGLLKSEMFGLASTLDVPTLRQLQERNELLAKKANEGLSAVEESRLIDLRRQLDDLGFSREHRDPLYQLFIQKMYEVRSQPLADLLTSDELQAQEALAEAVVTELVRKDRTEELSAVAKDLKINLES